MRHLILLFISLFFFLLFVSKVDAATYSGVGANGQPASFDFDPTTGCTNITDSQVTTSDLTPCVDTQGPYSNTCCTSGTGCTAADGSSLSQWQWNFASGCVASRTFGSFCSVQYKYQTQTCNSTDTCRAEPALYPGLCTNNGCAIGTVQYKYCCNGACNGGDYTGTCPGGNFQFCGGAGQPPCNASACPTLTPTPTPTPPGTTPPPGVCPTTGGWEGGPCTQGSSNAPESCSGANSTTCNFCSVKSCFQYSGSLYCWYNDRSQCYNDPNFCRGLNCGSTCVPGTQTVTCSGPNACTVPSP